jgi:uncharacterized protein YndB with AHSA1/START domain/peroxiredoxin
LWTDPASIRRWFAPGMVVRECECRCEVGGKYRFVCAYANGQECTVQGEFLTVEPEKKLVYTWNVSGTHQDVADTLVTVMFEPVSEGGDSPATRLSIRHEKLGTEGARKDTQHGWSEIVELLEKLHEIERMERRTREAKQEIVRLRKTLPKMPVPNATLKRLDGTPVSVSELFGKTDELMIIHNMGKGCPYCTLWADHIKGFHEHMSNRAPFVLLTPDAPDVARAFAASRGWTFPIISAYGTTFIRDMGFEPEPGRAWPGMSTLKRKADGSIERVAYTHFGPWDDFAGIWPMLAMHDKGINNWEPKYTYT